MLGEDVIQPKDERNKAFTAFPAELLEAIKDSFSEDFKSASNEGSFISFGQIHPTEIILRVGYIKDGEISQVNFDCSTESSGSEASVIKSIEELVFTAKELFVDFFKNGKLEHFSYHWNPFGSSSKVYYKLDRTNTDLEAQANALLGETLQDKEKLIVGDMSETDEIEKIVESLQTSSFTFK
jgi:hypothetical protein